MNFNDIAAYYDEHALAWASQFDKKSATMHPPQRVPGKTISRIRSIRAGEELVYELCAALDAQRVFDLGTGFASSLLYLSNIRPDTIYSGICASDTELEIARGLIRESGRVQTISVFKGDFEDGRNYRVFPAQDVVFALDSWRHTIHAQKTLSLIAGMVRPGGRFLVLDWFSVTDGNRLRSSEVACLNQWRDNAALSTIPDLKTFLSDAENAGFALVKNQSCGDAVAIPILSGLEMTMARPLSNLFNKSLARVWQARLSAERARKWGLLDYRAIELIRP